MCSFKCVTSVSDQSWHPDRAGRRIAAGNCQTGCQSHTSAQVPNIPFQFGHGWGSRRPQFDNLNRSIKPDLFEKNRLRQTSLKECWKVRPCSFVTLAKERLSGPKRSSPAGRGIVATCRYQAKRAKYNDYKKPL